MTDLTASDVAVVTIVAGRHEHLRRHRASVAALDPAPALHVVVSMGDGAVAALVADGAALPTRVVELAPRDLLPLAAARNEGVGVARQAGARAVALLDVDCIAERRFAADIASGLSRLGPEPTVVCGRVRYLPQGMAEADHTPERLAELGRDHPARVIPPTDDPVRAEATMLWSLNLGIRTADWDRIGGFDERYEGYGGEDTDFGQRLQSVGGQLWWLRGAGAFHQYHPVSTPPAEHAADIARNANLFHATWGWYPMQGWLDALTERGLLAEDDDGYHPA